MFDVRIRPEGEEIELGESGGLVPEVAGRNRGTTRGLGCDTVLST